MPDWKAIMDEAERLANSLIALNVDLSEAGRLSDYFIYKSYNSQAVSEYLKAMSENPPPRSRRSQMHFKNLRQIWDGWKSSLSDPKDKAIAWGWGVKKARAKRLK